MKQTLRSRKIMYASSSPGTLSALIRSALAPEDVEMEDLNYYYANYSRYAMQPSLVEHCSQPSPLEYIMTSLPCVEAQATCQSSLTYVKTFDIRQLGLTSIHASLGQSYPCHMLYLSLSRSHWYVYLTHLCK